MVLVQMCVEGGEGFGKMGEVYWFDQIGIGFKVQCLQFILLLIVGVDYYQIVVFQFMQIVQYVEVIFVGQVDINQYDIYWMVVQLLLEGFGVVCFLYFEVVIVQSGQQFIQQIGVIFNYCQL